MGKKIVFYLLNYINFILFYSHVFHLKFFFSLIMVLRIQKHIDNNLHILLFFEMSQLSFAFYFIGADLYVWTLCTSLFYFLCNEYEKPFFYKYIEITFLRFLTVYRFKLLSFDASPRFVLNMIKNIHIFPNIKNFNYVK